jgi:hypothetical protein
MVHNQLILLKLFSYKGALLKHHLMEVFVKVFFDKNADAKLAAWLEAKAGKVDAKKEGLTKAQVAEKPKLSKQSKKLMLTFSCCTLRLMLSLLQPCC